MGGFNVSESESPGMYMQAIRGELVLGAGTVHQTWTASSSSVMKRLSSLG